MIYFIVLGVKNNLTYIVYELKKSFLEIFLLQIFGVGQYSTNHGAVWYLSVLLVSSYIVYALLYCDKKMFLYVFGIIFSIGGYLYLWTKHGTIISGWDSSESIFANSAFVRGLAGVSTGVLLYYCPKLKVSDKLLRIYEILEILSFVLSYVIAILGKNSSIICLVLLTLNVYISLCISHKTPLFNNRIILYFSRLSYSLYLTHPLFVDLLSVEYLGISNLGIRLLVYFVITTLFSVLFYHIYSFLFSKLESMNIVKQEIGNGRS